MSVIIFWLKSLSPFWLCVVLIGFSGLCMLIVLILLFAYLENLECKKWSDWYKHVVARDFSDVEIPIYYPEDQK